MKMKFIITTILIIVLLIAVMIFCLCTKIQRMSEKENRTVNSFDISDYSWELNNYGYKKNIGPVTTKNIAIEKAKLLWEEKFGKLYVDNNLPIAVAYDEKSECWRVNGTLQDNNIDGAVPCAIISKEGDVLALWFG